MKRWMLVVLVVLFAALPASAQDVTCEIDLSEAMSVLARAQIAADEGVTAAALAHIAEARAMLSALENDCDAPPTVELDKTFRFEVSDSFDFVIQYPSDWLAESPDVGTVFLATSPDVLDLATESPDPPPLDSGEALMFLAFSNLENLSPSARDAATVDALLNTFIEDNIDVVGEAPVAETTFVADRPAARTAVSGDGNEILFLMLDLGRFEGERAFVLFVLITAPDELSEYEPTALAIAESLHLE